MLFTSGSSYTSTGLSTARRTNQRRRIYTWVKWALVFAACSIFTFFLVCRVDVHARVYVREWLASKTPSTIEPLSNSCFANVSPTSAYYQGRARYAPSFVPGVPLWDAQTCYDFAGLVHGRHVPHNRANANQADEIFFHTYWSSNLTAITDKQLATWQSFVATQDANRTHLIVWIAPDDEATLVDSPQWQTAMAQSRSRLQYKTFDVNTMAGNTPLDRLVAQHPLTVKARHEDLLRLFALYHHGGVWFDLDTLFIRDLMPLLGEEWISQGSCYTSLEGNPFDGALLHFHKQSPYLCEMLASVADQFKVQDGPDRLRITDSASQQHLEPRTLQSDLYYRIFRRLLHHGIKPWLVVPWCFTDPSECRRSNSLPSAFAETDFNPRRLSQIFAYHWHQQWDATPGSIFRHIQTMNEETLLSL
ncbi:hypothetical protein DFQ28_006612 [Apophysomyces sp. BC1034]|nr:hypothetical protein DFQ30_003375 [Apophysomyces sp. BC1015]KAG0183003.1 hypothetical protein DFQ29_000814 [Apophysomyces sp. BC1021]KAG0194763.1 hypothetical protein DFQ28_006612 [Apophysomyces sp. BC1034]